METVNAVSAQDEIFSIEQLESRFEMLAVPTGDLLHPDWSCTTAITFNR